MNQTLQAQAKIIRGTDTESLHDVNRVVTIFNSLFLENFTTRLRGGGDEPLYRPATKPDQYHEIIFTRDYFASALHEVAHWCVAGEQRRLVTDYGYWYSPDGRNNSQQQLFEKAEVKPQALEWMFSRAANYGFRLSSDNLASNAAASKNFKTNVHAQVINYCEQGFPSRALLFAAELQRYFGGVDFENKNNYQIEML